MPNFRSFIGSELLAIKQHLASVKSIIPEKMKLAPSERRSMFKLHLKRRDFARNALALMRRNPSSAPSFVDIQACNNYMQLYDQYSELLQEVDAVKKQLEDARLLVGHEILKQTRSYFQNAKNGADSGDKQFETIYRSLKPFYAVGRNSKKLEEERV
ncbi:MAG: hypothetical protein K2Q21_09795 [Chitinophagaceae bacterium]|nr:hypothetical protein [Chitinophagaceae bacterium]